MFGIAGSSTGRQVLQTAQGADLSPSRLKVISALASIGEGDGVFAVHRDLCRRLTGSWWLSLTPHCGGVWATLLFGPDISYAGGQEGPT